jgi:hypothetical protein
VKEEERKQIWLPLECNQEKAYLAKTHVIPRSRKGKLDTAFHTAIK